ncbi:ubiquitin-conjugating enzyme/RWD-like protein, partial [Gorgonomyces haynaldii]
VSKLNIDLGDMDHLPKTMQMEFPDPNDVFHFKLYITPDEGFYKGGKFEFTFKVGSNYPHEPPKVLELTLGLVYHPNIDLEGNVCLNILREDWKPVLSLHSILIGLQYLFQEPNPDDPLNKGESVDSRCSTSLAHQQETL